MARIRDYLRDLVSDAIADDIGGESAKVAYYFFLSLFPFIVVVFAVTGLVGGNEAFQWITRAIAAPVPDAAWRFVRDLIREVTDHRRPGVLSAGIVLTLWAASGGIAALTGALNAMYDLRETRGWVKRHLIALAVLTLSVVLIVLAATAFVPGLGLLRRNGMSAAWSVARWPLALTLLTVATWLAYTYLPARKQHELRAKTSVGAATAIALWALATWVFQFYVSTIGRYGRVYGALGAVIALLIWFYLSAFAVLLGGEVAAQLERGSRTEAR